ncbi:MULTISPECIES: hypothetical protein [unclassified Vibrio]|uniref:hypothetical protein n=1 Tax=unclassified Vibrio TaxID=2614977 RepID=UPI0028085E81|nr:MULTISPECIES: hypothetical protein [unclassified Vibrio]ELA7191272.1 hypothetical protein [Vibrio alginolyticus]MDW1675170.1 hypothetical protein [Vibrio sp. Vb2610]MDW1807327.1 hypothetical protein [Vibrio sp. Vb2628]
MSESLPVKHSACQSAACQKKIPELIYRYVKPSHVSGDDVSDEAFQLRENRSPPEEYISFYYSEEKTQTERLRCVENRMCSSSNFAFKKTGGLLEINTIEAIETINQVRDLICFEHKKQKQKIGMHYLSKDPVDVLEARTTLAYLAQFNSKTTF